MSDNPRLSWPPPGNDPHVEDYTLIAFHQEVAEACKEAWENDHDDLTVVAIPSGMFPGLMEMVNPVTRSMIRVQRQDVKLFCGFAPKPHYNEKGEKEEL